MYTKLFILMYAIRRKTWQELLEKVKCKIMSQQEKNAQSQLFQGKTKSLRVFK